MDSSICHLVICIDITIQVFPILKIGEDTWVLCAISVFVNGFWSGFSFIEDAEYFSKIMKGSFVGITSLAIYVIFVFSAFSLRANERNLDRILENFINRQKKE